MKQTVSVIVKVFQLGHLSILVHQNYPKNSVKVTLMEKTTLKLGKLINLDIPNEIKEHILEGANFINQICSGCNGNHKLWTVAGGVVAFLLKKNDILQ